MVWCLKHIATDSLRLPALGSWDFVGGSVTQGYRPGWEEGRLQLNAHDLGELISATAGPALTDGLLPVAQGHPNGLRLRLAKGLGHPAPEDSLEEGTQSADTRLGPHA